MEQVDLAAPIYLEHADRQEQPVQEAAYVDYGLVEVKIVRGIAVVFCVNTVLKRLFGLSSDTSTINAVSITVRHYRRYCCWGILWAYLYFVFLSSEYKSRSLFP